MIDLKYKEIRVKYFFTKSVKESNLNTCYI